MTEEIIVLPRITYSFINLETALSRIDEILPESGGDNFIKTALGHYREIQQEFAAATLNQMALRLLRGALFSTVKKKCKRGEYTRFIKLAGVPKRTACYWCSYYEHRDNDFIMNLKSAVKAYLVAGVSDREGYEIHHDRIILPNGAELMIDEVQDMTTNEFHALLRGEIKENLEGVPKMSGSNSEKSGDKKTLEIVERERDRLVEQVDKLLEETAQLRVDNAALSGTLVDDRNKYEIAIDEIENYGNKYAHILEGMVGAEMSDAEAERVRSIMNLIGGVHWKMYEQIGS